MPLNIADYKIIRQIKGPKFLFFNEEGDTDSGQRACHQHGLRSE